MNKPLFVPALLLLCFGAAALGCDEHKLSYANTSPETPDSESIEPDVGSPDPTDTGTIDAVVDSSPQVEVACADGLDNDGDMRFDCADDDCADSVACAAAPCLAEPEFVDSGQQLGNSYSTDAALGDLDNDGDLDVVVANSFGFTNQVWLNDGVGGFANTGQELGGDAQRVALGDIDGDGDLDAFFANDAPNTVWFNDGTGRFRDSEQRLGDSSSSSVGLGDLNGDQTLDAMVCNTGGDVCRAWLNDGQGAFSSPLTPPPILGSFSDVELGDLDNDGDLDALVTSAGGQPNIVLLNDGAGRFEDPEWYFGGGSTPDGELADLDGDGDLDVMAVSTNTPTIVGLNGGSGRVIEPLFDLIPELGSFGLSLGDINGDGDLDALIANRREPNLVLLNEGSGVFVESARWPEAIGSRDAELGDLDGDGDRDAFFANGDNPRSEGRPNRVYFNLCVP